MDKGFRTYMLFYLTDAMYECKNALYELYHIV